MSSATRGYYRKLLAEHTLGLGNRDHPRMPGRVAATADLVPRFGQDLLASADESRERHLALLGGPPQQRNAPLHHLAVDRVAGSLPGGAAAARTGR